MPFLEVPSWTLVCAVVLVLVLGYNTHIYVCSYVWGCYMFMLFRVFPSGFSLVTFTFLVTSHRSCHLSIFISRWCHPSCSFQSDKTTPDKTACQTTCKPPCCCCFVLIILLPSCVITVFPFVCVACPTCTFVSIVYFSFHIFFSQSSLGDTYKLEGFWFYYLLWFINIVHIYHFPCFTIKLYIRLYLPTINHSIALYSSGSWVFVLHIVCMFLLMYIFLNVRPQYPRSIMGRNSGIRLGCALSGMLYSLAIVNLCYGNFDLFTE